jgi:hypothetical protein
MSRGIMIIENSIRIALLCSLIGTIFLSITIPNIRASTGGPLDRLGDMLGFETNQDNDDDNDSDSNDDGDSKTVTLPIPILRQFQQEIQSRFSFE